MEVGTVRIPARSQDSSDGPDHGGVLLRLLDRLLREERIERVSSDTDRARALLDDATRHLRSSATIAADDPEGAYALLYDAARKAVDAHMAAAGYRTRSRPGAHEAVALYARDAIGGEYAKDAHALDAMRKQRNRAEYGAWHISEARLRGDRVHAQRIVEAVRNELSD